MRHIDSPEKKKHMDSIVVYLLRARTVEADKQPLLGNARTHR
jgi:hypothetical protein